MINKTQQLHQCRSAFFTNAVAPARWISKGQADQAGQPVVKAPSGSAEGEKYTKVLFRTMTTQQF
jgi:hypothetical protein